MTAPEVVPFEGRAGWFRWTCTQCAAYVHASSEDVAAITAVLHAESLCKAAA